MRIERLTASEADAARLSEFLLEFAREHRFGSMPTTGINTDRAWARIWRLLRNGAVWVAIGNNGIAGSLSVMEDVLWWTDQRYLHDGWVYVRPDMRGSKAAIMLVNAASVFAAEQGLPLVVNVFHSGDPEMAGRFLTRAGFSVLGGTYIKE